MKDDDGHDPDRCPVCNSWDWWFLATIAFVVLGLIGLAAVTGWFA